MCGAEGIAGSSTWHQKQGRQSGWCGVKSRACGSSRGFQCNELPNDSANCEVLMSTRDPQQGWVFHFVLEQQEGNLLPDTTAEELLDNIIAWVEERGLEIG